MIILEHTLICEFELLNLRALVEQALFLIFRIGMFAHS